MEELRAHALEVGGNEAALAEQAGVVRVLLRDGRLQHAVEGQAQPVGPPGSVVAAHHDAQRLQQVLLLERAAGALHELLLRSHLAHTPYEQQHAPATLLGVRHAVVLRHLTRPPELLREREQGEGGLGLAVGTGVAEGGLEEGEDQGDAGARGGEDGNHGCFDIFLG